MDSKRNPGTDGDLVAALVNKAANYRDTVPVFHIVQPDPKKSLAQARELLLFPWPQFGDCSPFFTVGNGLLSQTDLPNNGSLRVFHPSGAIAASMRPSVTQMPIAEDERTVDRKPLVEHTEKIARVIATQYISPDDELRFERLWEYKGRGTVISDQEPAGPQQTPVALFEVLGAFRRYLHGLPVLGRASVHVSVGAASTVTRWGIDWRQPHPEPFVHTSTLDPMEGAKRIMDDLWWRRPERPFTLKDFEPQSFQLGYVSFSRQREQYMIQPAWVAIFAPRGGTTMGHVVAVPAAPQAFEPMGRPTRTPPPA